MKKIILLIAIGILIACNSKNKSTTIDFNQNFEEYKNTFIHELWKTYPGWALSVGKHDYDSILSIPNEETIQKEISFCKNQLDSLKKYPIDSLTSSNKTDYLLIENHLNSTIWYSTVFKSYEWDPSNFNVCGSFAEILNSKFDSLDNRLVVFNKRMINVPTYYEAAKKLIKNPTIEHTQLAIAQNLGGLSVFETDLKDALSKSKLEGSVKNTILENASKSVSAIKNYADWLKNLKNENPREFRIGKELHTKKFEFDIQSGYTAEEVYNKAIERKSELHHKMAEITFQLWNNYFKQPIPQDTLVAIRTMIDKLSGKHTTPDSFQTAIEQQIPILVDFINQKNLIYLDPSKPLVVRKEPAYMAGVAGASISSPGPYDKEGNTYYNVGSMEDWSAELAESYLREYNHYILQILNIHEAIPGHYTQLIYSNQSPSLIKSILGNGAMIEGWAVYTELMMLENGYGNNEPEMWLMYYKWNLRTVCNTILDYSVHSLNMSKDEAMNLLINQAFQQTAEAEGKWKRATLTQVQLCSYFTGFKEIVDFREEYKQKKGKEFDLKQFHEKFLSFGSAPVKHIKKMMLSE
ncbi:MAG: DUF885 domain-containing protein [Flavobacteriales bacterium]|nr:DUF885 domain-containing protein [Flavobacteriales bacterium]